MQSMDRDKVKINEAVKISVLEIPRQIPPAKIQRGNPTE